MLIVEVSYKFTLPQHFIAFPYNRSISYHNVLAKSKNRKFCQNSKLSNYLPSLFWFAFVHLLVLMFCTSSSDSKSVLNDCKHESSSLMQSSWSHWERTFIADNVNVGFLPSGHFCPLSFELDDPVVHIVMNSSTDETK